MPSSSHPVHVLGGHDVCGCGMGNGVFGEEKNLMC